MRQDVGADDHDQQCGQGQDDRHERDQRHAYEEEAQAGAARQEEVAERAVGDVLGSEHRTDDGAEDDGDGRHERREQQQVFAAGHGVLSGVRDVQDRQDHDDREGHDGRCQEAGEDQAATPQHAAQVGAGDGDHAWLSSCTSAR